jgi:hypothetical protein
LKKRLLSTILSVALIAGLLIVPAFAKTTESAKAEKVFFYAKNSEGKNVLLKVIPLDDLKKISHGQAIGANYYISSTDNYPTTQYCEARGVTVPELVDYVKSVTTVQGADKLGFSGNDTLRLMATDSYGNYNRSWTYNELYGVKRYYFEGLFNSWNTGWEIAGEDNSKFGVSLDEYNEKYKDGDKYYTDKRAVFDGGIVTVPILATESFSGRTTTDTLVASTEIGIADIIKANGGVAAGSLKALLTDETALRLSLPMTEADLYAAHRTSFDNFKWTYNLLLEQENAPTLKSLGTVAEPSASISVSGDTLTITISCETPGASIFYSFDGAPQIPYSKSVTVDISGRNLAANPVTFYTTAVKEGFDDAGIITGKYPGLAPAFKTLYSGMAGQSLTFQAQDSVSASDWSAWTNALNSITLKTPSVNGYIKIDSAKYKIDNDKKSITFDGSLFADTGSYSFIFHASKYADKSTSLTVKKSAAEVTPATDLIIGNDMTFRFGDADYQSGVTLYVAPPGGAGVMISTSYLDRTQPGKVTLKAAYFATPGCAITDAGAYKFSFVNSKYDPGTIDISVDLTLGLPVADYEDVNTTNWYYSAVRYVMSLGLFDELGPASRWFGANEPLTRGELVEALKRLGGDPSEITDGTNLSNGVTREQIATMFHRYYGLPEGNGDLTVFPDADKVSDYALDALKWAVENRVINGTDGKLDPQGVATRIQVAQMLLNLSVL